MFDLEFFDRRQPIGYHIFTLKLVNPDTNHAECNPSDHAMKLISNMAYSDKEAENWSVHGMEEINNYKNYIVYDQNSVVLDVAKGGDYFNKRNVHTKTSNTKDTHSTMHDIGTRIQAIIICRLVSGIGRYFFTVAYYLSN